MKFILVGLFFLFAYPKDHPKLQWIFINCKEMKSQPENQLESNSDSEKCVQNNRGKENNLQQMIKCMAAFCNVL